LQNDEEEEELLDPAMIAAWPMHSCGMFKTGVTLTLEVLPSAPSRFSLQSLEGRNLESLGTACNESCVSLLSIVSTSAVSSIEGGMGGDSATCKPADKTEGRRCDTGIRGLEATLGSTKPRGTHETPLIGV